MNTDKTPNQEETKIAGLNAGFDSLMETVAPPGAGEVNVAELEAKRDSLKAKVEELETQLALSGEPIPDVATGTTTGEPAEANYGTGKAFVLEAILAAIPGNHSLAEHGYYRNVEALCGELKGAVDKAETERDSFKAENARLRDILRRVEWEGELSTAVYPPTTEEVCPVCWYRRTKGHRENCILAAALSGDREEEKNND